MNNFFNYHNIHKKYHHLWYGRCIVLLYHRVIDLDFDPQLLAVSKENFNTHLKIINSDYNCLTINEFHEYLDSGKKIPKNSIVLSFDDGYQDNYLHALPLLEKHNSQALFYITTGTIDKNSEFWWDEVERIMFSGQVPKQVYIKWTGFEFSLQSWNSKIRDELYNNVLPYLRNISVEARVNYIEDLREIFYQINTARETHLPMSLEELKKFASSKSAVIGAHTVNHPSLAHLTYEDQFIEIQQSVQFLSENLNQKIVDFSYPFGTTSNYNADTIAICKKVGLKYVAANFPKMVDKRSDKFQFPRFLVRNWDGKEFKLKLDEYFKADEDFTY